MSSDTSVDQDASTSSSRRVHVPAQPAMPTATYRPVPVALPPVDVQALAGQAAVPLDESFADMGAAASSRMPGVQVVDVDGRQVLVVRLPVRPVPPQGIEL